jgi:polyribonucleotide nucleotidyltransferase
MDFKVAGTSEGINALQMDIKVKGLTHDVLKDALAQAKVGRLFILDKMLEAISTPRETLSQYAPKMVRIMIPVDKIGTLIGPGGKTIRGMQEELGVTIDTQDSGAVTIGGSNQEAIERARDRIEGMTREITVGDIFTGKVSRITNFGVFVELIPGKDGLLRSEEMADTDEELNFGDEVTVMVKEIDHMGRTNLSRRALFGDATPRQSAEPSLRAPRPPGPRPGGPGFGPPRGGPGRGRPPSGPGGGPRRGGFGGGRPGGPSRQGPGQGFQR